MICKRCGAKNSETRQICFHCGNPLTETANEVWIDELPDAERSHSFHERYDQDGKSVRSAVPLTVDDEEEELLTDRPAGALGSAEDSVSVSGYDEDEENGEVIRASRGSFRSFYQKAFIPDDEDEAQAAPAREQKKSFRERYDEIFEPDDEEAEETFRSRKSRRIIDSGAFDPETNAFVVEPLEKDTAGSPKDAEAETESSAEAVGAFEQILPDEAEENEESPEDDPATETVPVPELADEPAEDDRAAEPIYPEDHPDYDTEDRTYDEQIKEESRRKAADLLDNTDESITEISLDEDDRELVFQSSHATRKKRSVGVMIAIWLLVLLFILIGIVLGILYYRSTHPAEQPPIIDPNKGTVEKLNLQDPILKKQTDSSGREYIHTVFYGEPGDRIFLSCNNSYRTFTENSMEIDLYLEDLFDSEYEFLENVVNANPNAYHVRDGKKYAYNTPSFSITVPESQLELLSPTKQNIKVYQDRYTIELWTSTNAKVTLNNNNITSAMDGSGMISYQVDIPEQSSTTYQLEVTQPYHTSRSEVFIISRDTLAVNLTIATSSASMIHDPYIDISGSTEAGAAISSNLPILEYSRNDVYNTYSMRINLSGLSYGKAEVIITADAGDGRVSSRSHTFWYWPDETQVTTTAYKFDSAVATNPSGYRNQTFKLSKARITKILSANKCEAAVTYNNVEYTLIIINDNRLVNKSLSVGSTYNIFAQCQGSQENDVPVFRAWYIYDA